MKTWHKVAIGAGGAVVAALVIYKVMEKPAPAAAKAKSSGATTTPAVAIAGELLSNAPGIIKAFESGSSDSSAASDTGGADTSDAVV